MTAYDGLAPGCLAACPLEHRVGTGDGARRGWNCSREAADRGYDDPDRSWGGPRRGGKARQGVRVRVLLDAFGARHIDRAQLAGMRRAGCQVAFFRPLQTWRLTAVNQRNHCRVLVCDEQAAMTGGIGVDRKWRGDARGPAEWRDTAVLVRGPAVAGCARPLHRTGSRPDTHCSAATTGSHRSVHRAAPRCWCWEQDRNRLQRVSAGNTHPRGAGPAPHPPRDALHPAADPLAMRAADAGAAQRGDRGEPLGDVGGDLAEG